VVCVPFENFQITLISTLVAEPLVEIKKQNNKKKKKKKTGETEAFMNVPSGKSEGMDIYTT
jgi:hypothetical protein